MGVNSPTSEFGPLWPDCLHPAESTEPADWAVGALWPRFSSNSQVGCFVPSSFDAFARIEHVESNEGSLSSNEVDVLLPILGDHTTADRVWYAIWRGWGSWGPGMSLGHLRAGRPTRRERAEERAMFREAKAALERVPELRSPGRDYYLFVGPLDCASRLEISGNYQSASMWWPDDRSWFVATEVDANFTCIGASRACIKEIVGTGLRSTEAAPHDRIVWEDPGRE